MKIRRNALKVLMREKRIRSFTGLAGEVGISQVAMSRVVTGKAWPSEETMDGICRVLECQPGDFLLYEAAVQVAAA